MLDVSPSKAAVKHSVPELNCNDALGTNHVSREFLFYLVLALYVQMLSPLKSSAELSHCGRRLGFLAQSVPTAVFLRQCLLTWMELGCCIKSVTLELVNIALEALRRCYMIIVVVAHSLAESSRPSDAEIAVRWLAFAGSRIETDPLSVSSGLLVSQYCQTHSGFSNQR